MYQIEYDEQNQPVISEIWLFAAGLPLGIRQISIELNFKVGVIYISKQDFRLINK
jgi:hypothetical protein